MIASTAVIGGAAAINSGNTGNLTVFRLSAQQVQSMRKDFEHCLQ